MLLANAKVLRPSLSDPKPCDVGFRLGRGAGVDCWAGVRDSTVLLGPPGSGKGLHVVIPMILDAPGPVITTSTRPDNLAVALRERARRGPVAVFDPEGLAPGVPPHALVAGAGMRAPVAIVHPVRWPGRWPASGEATCGATIVGGWERGHGDVGYFGVHLSL
jgi:type IV secretion system protein VirD4